MEEVVREYYESGKLGDVNHEELSKYLLSNIFPKDEIKVLDGYVRLRHVSPFPIGEYGCDYSIVEAARVSYGSGLKGVDRDRKLIKFLKDNRHTTPFEHITFSFTISCPIFVMRHIMRHRVFSFNEVSARYTETPDCIYVPESLRKQSTSNRQCSVEGDVDNSLIEDMISHNKTSYDLYTKLLDNGVAREQARTVLPVGIYSQTVMTGNLKNWMHFLGLRDASDSQYETRLYAKAIRSIIEKYCPISSKV